MGTIDTALLRETYRCAALLLAAAALVAGCGAPVSEYVKFAPVELRDELEAILAKTDSLHYVSRAAPSALFFQVARKDEIVPRGALEELASAGSEPKEVRWYDSGHVPSAKAWADSRQWLGDRLGLTGE